MPVEEGVTFFANEPAVSKKIEVLNDLGLGYLTLGQSATTLSGGEAQRIKIATELSKLQRSPITSGARARMAGGSIRRSTSGPTMRKACAAWC